MKKKRINLLNNAMLQTVKSCISGDISPSWRTVVAKLPESVSTGYSIGELSDARNRALRLI